MDIRRVTMVLFVAGFVAVGCSKSKGGAKSGGDDGITAYDEEGNGKPCAKPESSCEVSKEASLSFKDACRLGGYRIQLCGCEELCTGNVSGAKSGYDRKNTKKDCPPPKDACPEREESAAFQDACSEGGHQLIECGCEWLCSGKLKEALPDPEPEEKPEEAGEGEKKDGDEKGDEKSKKKDSD